jgi:hypothetical protein
MEARPKNNDETQGRFREERRVELTSTTLFKRLSAWSLLDR